MQIHIILSLFYNFLLQNSNLKKLQVKKEFFRKNLNLPNEKKMFWPVYANSFDTISHFYASLSFSFLFLLLSHSFFLFLFLFNSFYASLSFLFCFCFFVILISILFLSFSVSFLKFHFFMFICLSSAKTSSEACKNKT